MPIFIKVSFFDPGVFVYENRFWFWVVGGADCLLEASGYRARPGSRIGEGFKGGEPR